MDNNRSKDEMSGGNARLKKGVSVSPGEIDTLVENAVFGADAERELSREQIRQLASAHGIVSGRGDTLYRRRYSMQSPGSR
jgi:hypothetical protein